MRLKLPSQPIKNYKCLKEDISGIYLLSYKGKIIYIGQSAYLKSRIRSHCNLDLKRCAKGYAYKIENEVSFRSTVELARRAFISVYIDDIKFSYLPCPIEKLNCYEEQMIRIAKPIFNYAGVDGEYIPAER